MPEVKIITLDGPAGVGKSTLAQALARELNLPFLDTGAMFRCVAYELGEKALDLPGTELSAKLAALDFSLRNNGGSGNDSLLLCGGRAPGNEIRGEQVGGLASRLAALPEVREFLKQEQQKLGRQSSLVAEGRDMGTVVFPNAYRKFFLDAEPRVRARRRQLQLAEQRKKDCPNNPNHLENENSEAELERIEAQIRQRDDLDRNRAIAPLRPAADAIIVDTSQMSLEEVLARLLDYVRIG